jgi:hypothetical protein
VSSNNQPQGGTPGPEESRALHDLARGAEEVLFECTTVFPFTLFPDQIKVYPNKIDVIDRIFFFSKSVVTILIQDLQTVEIDTDLFFASIRFEWKGYERAPIVVKFLPKVAALRLRQMIMGLVTARREGVPLQKIDTPTIKEEATKIGDVKEDLTSI